MSSGQLVKLMNCFMVKTIRKVDFMNFNILVFIGGVIMALSVLGIALANDEYFSKFGWFVFCVGLTILGIGGILNFS